MTPDDYDLADVTLLGPLPSDAVVCRDADALAVALACAAGSATPPAAVRANLLHLIDTEPRPFIKSAADGAWENWLVPGLSRRVLFVDRPRKRVTMLLRLSPGSRLPSHSHPGVEEVYMLDGDLHGEDGNVLRAGDYQRSEAGTVHIDQWSVGGCTALLIAPLVEEWE